MDFQVASLFLFQTAIFKIPLSQATNHQNKQKKTKLNNMAVTLRVFFYIFISFKSPKYHLQRG